MFPAYFMPFFYSISCDFLYATCTYLLLSSFEFSMLVNSRKSWHMFPYIVDVYGFAFISYHLGIFSLSMTAVMHLFGSGIVVGTTFASFGTCVFF